MLCKSVQSYVLLKKCIVQFVQSSNIDKQFESLWVVHCNNFYLFFFPGMVLIIIKFSYIIFRFYTYSMSVMYTVMLKSSFGNLRNNKPSIQSFHVLPTHYSHFMNAWLNQSFQNSQAFHGVGFWLHALTVTYV